MKRITLLTGCLFLFLLLSAQPKTEIRAVWLTTNYGLDWPSTDKNPTSQKKKLQVMLDKLQAININTIYFQVQCRADVFWDSKHQPWSRHITGTAGQKPSYDVLQFVIDECHARNMEAHAWVVPYPLGSTSVANLIGSEHVSKKRPELCVLYSNEWYLDPGLPATTDYLIELYTELVEKYDFDGVSLDYTRYPGADFPDTDSYNKYGGGMNKNNWRRQNINKFVHRLYDLIQSKKPDMRLSAAPVGAYESLPNASSGFTAHTHVFQDPVEWMSAGKLDLSAPQVYWQDNYEAHLANWVKKSNNRPIVAGLAAYKMLPAKDGEDWEASVITEQIETARKLDAKGICFFRTEQITSNYKGIYDKLKSEQFKYPANIPPMDWHGVSKPNTPQQVEIKHKEGNTYTIHWKTPELVNSNPIRYYSVYMSNTQNVDINDVKNLAAHYITGNQVDYTLPNPGKEYYFTVTSFDKGYYESDASQMVSLTPTTNLNHVPQANILVAQNGHELQINSDTAVKTIYVYSVNGIVQHSSTHNSEQVNIDIATLTSGVYIVTVQFNDGSVVKQKIIK